MNNQIQLDEFNIPIAQELPPPQILLDAILHNDHETRGDFSVTQILEDPRCIVLKKEHPECVAEDAAKQVKAFIGTAVHNLIEKRVTALMDENMKNCTFIEQPLHISMNGFKISGTADMVHVHKDPFNNQTLMITDWKNWGTTKYMLQDFSTAYWQLQIYSLMARHMKIIEDNNADKFIRIVAIFSDWSKRSLMQFGDKYPQHQMIALQWHMLPEDRIIEFMSNKLDKIQAYQNMREEDRPDADSRSIWDGLKAVRVMKPDGKRAISGGVFEAKPGISEEEVHADAEAFKREKIQAGKYDDLICVEERKGRIKCNGYCPVANLCTTYQKYLAEKTKEEEGIFTI